MAGEKFGNAPDETNTPTLPIAPNPEAVAALASILKTRKPTFEEWVAAGLSEESFSVNYPPAPPAVAGAFEFIPTRAQWAAAGNAPEAYDERYGAEAVPTLPEATASAPGRPKRYIIDEPRERAVSVGPSTYIFRPQQPLNDAHLLRLARENDLLIREV